VPGVRRVRKIRAVVISARVRELSHRTNLSRSWGWSPRNQQQRTASSRFLAVLTKLAMDGEPGSRSNCVIDWGSELLVRLG
jgi:hypothetical protein